MQMNPEQLIVHDLMDMSGLVDGYCAGKNSGQLADQRGVPFVSDHQITEDFIGFVPADGMGDGAAADFIQIAIDYLKVVNQLLLPQLFQQPLVGRRFRIRWRGDFEIVPVEKRTIQAEYPDVLGLINLLGRQQVDLSPD